MTISIVSSTDNVVCDNHTRFSTSCRNSGSFATPATPSTRCVTSGASPAVPSTSSCPSCPTNKMWYPCFANRFASLCTFVTSGQVASKVFSDSFAASACTAGLTPWAEKITCAPSGTSSVSCTKIAPRSVSVSTTYRLCTISLRT